MDSWSMQGREGPGTVQTRGDGTFTRAPCAAKTQGKVPRASSLAALASPPLPHGGPSATSTPGAHSVHADSLARAHGHRSAFFPRPDGAFQSNGNHEPHPAGPGSISASFPRPAGLTPAPPWLPSPAASLPRWTPASPAVGRASSPPCVVPGPRGSRLLQTTFSGQNGLGSQRVAGSWRSPGRSLLPPLPPALLPSLPLSNLMTSTWASGIPSQASQHCLKSPNLEEI